MTISRRSFVLSAGTTLAALAGSPRLVLPWRRRYSIVIRGGTVFDGLGSPGVEADIAIDDGRIVAIGQNLVDQGAVEIDARGMAVAPGFIDIHSHGDGSLWDDPRSESIVRQGVTTIVVGQDGSSRAPTGREPDEDNGRHSFSDFKAFWQSLASLEPSVNVASMVGLGSVRGIVIGNVNRPAKPDEIARMTQLVEQALADGACGASSGLEYTPGAFATRNELIALCKPLASRRLPYATHMRNEDDHVLEAVDESIAVAAGANCPLQISHLKTEGPRNWHKLDEIFTHIHRARGSMDIAVQSEGESRKGATPVKKRASATTSRTRSSKSPKTASTTSADPAGIDVAFDRYPYIAYQTGLSNLFPVWSRDGSTDDFLRRLDDPATSEKIRHETVAKVELIGGWDNVQISGIANYADMAAEGKRVGSFAKTQMLEPYALVVALLQRGKANVGMVGFAMSEDNLDRILAHPQGMVCSDGGAYALDGATHKGRPHPRGLGTFPRVLGRYVREKKVLTLASAIHKMSGLPASRIGIEDRGRLAPGMAADVVVFDPSAVADKATFEDPFQYPVGIKAVVVNGVVALREGQRSSDRSGEGLQTRG
ncbi:MAG TPA: D-aminoacylase [Gemmatimonadaceae bacterium]|nr:D-aminoacylase [Gemmatimonadaceae bacterium]